MKSTSQHLRLTSSDLYDSLGAEPELCVFLTHDMNYNKRVISSYASFTGNFKVKTVMVIYYFDW